MLSRRAALQGGTATVAAIAVTGAVVARVAVADPMVSLIRETKAAGEAWDAAESALDKARHKVGYENAPIWALVEVQTDHGPRIYGPSEIELAATPEGCYGTHITAEQRDRYLTHPRHVAYRRSTAKLTNKPTELPCNVPTRT